MRLPAVELAPATAVHIDDGREVICCVSDDLMSQECADTLTALGNKLCEQWVRRVPPLRV